MDAVDAANIQHKRALLAEQKERQKEARADKLKRLEIEESIRRDEARSIATVKEQSIAASRFFRPPVEKRAREVAKCEKIQRKAWKQFCRSCEDKVVVTVKEVIDKKSGKIRELAHTERIPQRGDASLIRVLLSAMERSAALQGLDLALARQPASSVTVNVGTMSDDELLAIASARITGHVPRRSSAGSIEASSSPVEVAGLHPLHQARLLGPVVSPADNGEAGRDGGGDSAQADDLSASADREDGTGEPAITIVPFGEEP